jgi:hypothetical protein
MNEVRLCKDCLFISGRKCMHPNSGDIDLVDGERDPEYASVLRLDCRNLKSCGKAARWFSSKAGGAEKPAEPSSHRAWWRFFL